MPARSAKGSRGRRNSLPTRTTSRKPISCPSLMTPTTRCWGPSAPEPPCWYWMMPAATPRGSTLKMDDQQQETSQTAEARAPDHGPAEIASDALLSLASPAGANLARRRSGFRAGLAHRPWPLSPPASPTRGPCRLFGCPAWARRGHRCRGRRRAQHLEGERAVDAQVVAEGGVDVEHVAAWLQVLGGYGHAGWCAGSRAGPAWRAGHPLGHHARGQLAAGAGLLESSAGALRPGNGRAPDRVLPFRRTWADPVLEMSKTATGPLAVV